MKLNETYCKLIDNFADFDNQILADRCEKAADSNAIEFGKWMNNQVMNPKGTHYHLYNKMYVGELYLIFKRVKEL